MTDDAQYGRRAADRLDGWKLSILLWQERWGRTLQLLMGGWLVLMSIGLTVLAILFYGSEHDRRRDQDAANRQSAATAVVAWQSCRRSQLLGPPLVRFYGESHALAGELLLLAGSTIPKSCGRMPKGAQDPLQALRHR